MMASLGHVAGVAVPNAHAQAWCRRGPAPFTRQRVTCQASALRTAGSAESVEKETSFRHNRRALLAGMMLVPLLGNATMAEASTIKKGAKVSCVFPSVRRVFAVTTTVLFQVIFVQDEFTW